MNPIYRSGFQQAVSFIGIGLLTTTSFAFAQDQSIPPPPASEQQQTANPSGGWKRVGDGSAGTGGHQTTSTRLISQAIPTRRHRRPRTERLTLRHPIISRRTLSPHIIISRAIINNRITASKDRTISQVIKPRHPFRHNSPFPLEHL